MVQIKITQKINVAKLIRLPFAPNRSSRIKSSPVERYQFHFILIPLSRSNRVSYFHCKSLNPRPELKVNSKEDSEKPKLVDKYNSLDFSANMAILEFVSAPRVVQVGFYHCFVKSFLFGTTEPYRIEQIFIMKIVRKKLLISTNNNLPLI